MEVVEHFLTDCPAAVVVRGTLENLLRPERLETIFAGAAKTQYTRSLAFARLVELMAAVVIRARGSVHAAYHARGGPKAVGVACKSVYEKLRRVEPAVGAALVAEIAADAAAAIDAFPGAKRTLLPGCEVRILDGNHPTSTEHRLEVLRQTRSGPLPCQVLAVFDPQRRLFTAIVGGEDAHAQERALCDEVLPCVRAGETWLADRNFATRKMLFGVADRDAFFVFRQHASLKATMRGRRRRIGRIDTGVVFEQEVEVVRDEGTNQERKLACRRITIVLDKPTGAGEAEVHLLTNLPKRHKARAVADAYRLRWRIEGHFQKLSETLRCAVATLGYPRAALFAFAVATLASNVHAVVEAALAAAHGQEKIDEELSHHLLVQDVAATHAGLGIAVPDSAWEPYRKARPKQLARLLLGLARRVDLSRYPKKKRGPKKPQPRKVSGSRHHHVSTQRLLEAARSH